ncbi:MAG: BrxE family protein [Anaerolineae bacterium]
MVSMPAHPTSVNTLMPGDAEAILRLRLLIARAANRDSLAWWDDESLSASAQFLLERLFSVAPPLAARSLALRAAWTRHVAALAAFQRAAHLYRLDSDNQDELALRDVPRLPIPYPDAPIKDMQQLRRSLLELTGQPIVSKTVREAAGHGLEIALPPRPPGVSLWLHRARTLAWAYLEGSPGQAVFPFIMEQPA